MSKLIQWPRAKYWDRAWNPVIGCRPVSPACENCWAREWAGRFGQSFEPHEGVRMKPPSKGVVFCGNMTDLFGEWVPENHLMQERLFGEKAVYLWLTKRVANMNACVRIAGVLSNFDESHHYFGFTAEDQCWFGRRMVEWTVPAWAKLWVSAEPLLGPINLSLSFNNIRWVVVGCESGPHRRPCKVEWVEKIVEECMAAGVPVFVKQLDLGGRCVTDIERFPEHLRVRQVPWAARQDMDGRMA